MTALDKYLQHQRIRQVVPYINDGATLLDVGCHQGELLLQLKERLAAGTGIDPRCKPGEIYREIRLIQGMFPSALPAGKQFDFVCALAVLEHIPASDQPSFFGSCHGALKRNGKLLLTVPHPRVDIILKLLRGLGLVKAMSFEEHYGFDVKQTPGLAMLAGFHLAHHHTFQLGLNNLFVFERVL